MCLTIVPTSRNKSDYLSFSNKPLTAFKIVDRVYDKKTDSYKFITPWMRHELVFGENISSRLTTELDKNERVQGVIQDGFHCFFKVENAKQYIESKKDINPNWCIITVEIEPYNMVLTGSWIPDPSDPDKRFHCIVCTALEFPKYITLEKV